jgi:hypothetical protein
MYRKDKPRCFIVISTQLFELGLCPGQLLFELIDVARKLLPGLLGREVSSLETVPAARAAAMAPVASAVGVALFAAAMSEMASMIPRITIAMAVTAAVATAVRPPAMSPMVTMIMTHFESSIILMSSNDI